MKTKQINPAWHARQGDVIIERLAALPTGAREEKARGRIILAHGEVTGHAHAIALPVGKTRPAKLFRVAGEPETVGYLEIAEALRDATAPDAPVVEVRHDEHSPIPLAPGIYRFRRQREYAPDEIRIVAD